MGGAPWEQAAAEEERLDKELAALEAPTDMELQRAEDAKAGRRTVRFKTHTGADATLF